MAKPPYKKPGFRKSKLMPKHTRAWDVPILSKKIVGQIVKQMANGKPMPNSITTKHGITVLTIKERNIIQKAFEAKRRN